MRDTIIRYLRHLPRALLFSAVFFGIPLGLLFLGGQQWYEEKAHRMQRLLVQDLDNYLATWRTEHPFLTHLEYTLRKYGNLALSAPDTRTALKSFIHQMQKRFPDTLHFLCLDNRGNVLPDLSEFQPNHTLIQRFYQDYTLLEANLPGPMTRHVHQYRDFLGPMIGRDKEIKIYNKMLIASQREKRSYVYLSPATAAGMFLVFIDRHSKFDQICLTDLARTHSRVCSPWIVQLYDLKNPTAPANTLPPNLQGSADAMLGLLESGSQPQLFAHGYLWHAMTHLGTFRLLIGVPDHSHLYLLEHLEVLKIAVGCVFSLLFLAVFVLFSQPTPISFSIRGKLTLLFLYLVGTPLLLMAISAHGFVRDRRAVLENQLFQKQEEFLNAFDRGYPEANGVFERQIQQMINPPLDAGRPVADLQKRFQTINELYQPVMGEVFDDQGKTRFQLETAWSGITKRIITGIQGAAANLLRDINHEPLQDKVSAKEQLINMTAEFLGFNIEMIMAGFSQNLGCLREFGASKGTIQILMAPLFNARGKAEYLSLLAWQNEMLEVRYARTYLASFTRLLPHSRLYADSSDSEYCVPEDFAEREMVRTYHRHLEFRETTLKRLIESPTGDRYLSAMNGKFLKNYRLFVITDGDSISEELRQFMGGYLFLCLVVLVLSLCAGMALARQFFVPVEQFGNGLQAMAERRFDHRIPIENRDEFGLLAGTFNVMLESLEDLEVAKVVQETFFPQEALICHDWEVSGSSVAASRVGGDYFDYFPLGSDRIGILIGDVSGHGVGAALVVAMAKALLCHPKTESDPQKVLQTIQGVMLKTLKRKKIMTCFFAVFQPATGSLLVANAGHSFPFLVRSDRVEQIEIPGSPLGTRLCRIEAPTARTLSDQDFLVLYTDGLVEAHDEAGSMIGEKRVAGILPTLRGNRAQETVENLSAWHAQETGGRTPPEDDITLVVLQKTHPGASAKRSPEPTQPIRA